MKCLVVCLLGLMGLNVAYATTCYYCDSSKEVSCSYGIVSFIYPTKDCNEGLLGSLPQSCVKVTATNKNGESYVARGCVPSIGQSVCNAIVKSAGFFTSLETKDDLDVNCYTCDTDKCNSSQRIAATTFVAILIALAAFMF
ncbi:uncharacterized protein LOC109594668 [Aethina tumida]|uniref:uncharacterized protein LOC109594668 n=1 Tax=Aethina tumida TaxID=116153 RepID=UPI00096B2374|nr:uncharacterized protein LOC109594668 [Aethina tumida]